MDSGIRPQPLEKSQKINNCRAMFIPDSRVRFFHENDGICNKSALGLNSEELDWQKTKDN